MALTPNMGPSGRSALSGLRPIVRPIGSALVTPGAVADLTAPRASSAGSAIQNAGSYVSAPAGSPPGTPPGTHPVTTTTTPPLADLSGNAWMAQLTPDQLGALGNAQATYTQNVGDQNQRITDANTQYTDAYNTAAYNSQVQQAQANEEMAARGLFVSGIRDSDMTDIQRTMTEAQTVAKANLDTLVGEATRAITALNSGWGATLGAYQGDAAANAAAAQQAASTTQTTYVPNAPAPAPAAPARPAAPPAFNRAGVAGSALANFGNRLSQRPSRVPASTFRAFGGL